MSWTRHARSGHLRHVRVDLRVDSLGRRWRADLNTEGVNRAVDGRPGEAEPVRAISRASQCALHRLASQSKGNVSAVSRGCLCGSCATGAPSDLPRASEI